MPKREFINIIRVQDAWLYRLGHSPNTGIIQQFFNYVWNDLKTPVLQVTKIAILCYRHVQILAHPSTLTLAHYAILCHCRRRQPPAPRPAARCQSTTCHVPVCTTPKRLSSGRSARRRRPRQLHGLGAEPRPFCRCSAEGFWCRYPEEPELWVVDTGPARKGLLCRVQAVRQRAGLA
jgi:hypothetical protein